MTLKYIKIIFSFFSFFSLFSLFSFLTFFFVFSIFSVFPFFSLNFQTSFFAFANPATDLSPLMNPISITNRAQCSIQSKDPTLSFFLLGDSFNAGKLGYRWAQLLNKQDSEKQSWSKSAMLDFRLSASGLLQEVIQKILDQNLPLLPIEQDVKSIENQAYNIEQGDREEEIKSILRPIWTLSENPKLSQKELLIQLKKWGPFDSKSFFPRALKAKVHCQILKKFSPLQMNLHLTKPSTQDLLNLINTVNNQKEYIASCNSQDDSLDSRNFILQYDLLLDLQSLSEKNRQLWNSIGFQFWSSVKYYFSWSWRNSSDLNHWSPRYAQTFRSLDLEDSLMMVSNGCQSLRPPQCDRNTLNLNSLRELAKITPSSNRLTPSVDKYEKWVPEGPEMDLLFRGARSVNDDFLETLSAEEASTWVNQWSKKFIEQRWVVKNKLFFAWNAISEISQQWTPQELISMLKEHLNKTNALDQSNSSYPQELINSMAHLCLEWNLSSNSIFDFLKTDIENIAKLKSMNKALPIPSQGISNQDIIHYFQKVGELLGPFCLQLEKKKFFSDPDWSGLAPWAKEMTQKQMPPLPPLPASAPATPPPASASAPAPAPPAPAPAPPLAIPAQQTQPAALCDQPIECLRRVLKSAVDLHYVSLFAEGFLPIHSSVPSAEWFNPYSELQACKIYDPWYVSDHARKTFLTDLASSLLFGWAPLPIYLNVDYSGPKVTSFKELIENGQLKFDPKFESEKTKLSLILDLGPYFGTPCFIQLDPSSEGKNVNFYVFQGLSVQACHANSKNKSFATSANQIEKEDPQQFSVCGTCSIHFSGISSAAASFYEMANGLNPAKFGIYLFRTFYRLAQNMEDSTNIPKSYEIQPEFVMDAYKEHNDSLPEYCLEPLSQGLRCFSDLCTSRVARIFESQFGFPPKEVLSWPLEGESEFNPHRKKIYIRSDLCEGELFTEYDCSHSNVRPDDPWKIQFRSFNSSCNHKLDLFKKTKKNQRQDSSKEQI